MHYCVLMHQEISLLLHDSTDVYATSLENDHYVYHNVVVTVAISNGCPTSTTIRECSPHQKVCCRDLWVYTRTCEPCVRKLSTHPSCLFRTATVGKQTVMIGSTYEMVCVCI